MAWKKIFHSVENPDISCSGGAKSAWRGGGFLLEQADQASGEGMGVGGEMPPAADVAGQIQIAQGVQMPERGHARDAQAGSQVGDGGGRVQQMPDDVLPARIGEGDGAADGQPVLAGRGRGKGRFHGLEQGFGRGDQRIGHGVVGHAGGFAAGLDQAPGLQAPQFLAGARFADPLGIGQLLDGEAGAGDDSAQQAQPRGSCQHPAGSPEGGVQCHGMFLLYDRCL